MALVRCGNCCPSCVSDGMAQEEDASERAHSDDGVETFISASQQSSENQSACCNVSTDFEEEIVISNTFLQVVRKRGGDE